MYFISRLYYIAVLPLACLSLQGWKGFEGGIEVTVRTDNYIISAFSVLCTKNFFVKLEIILP